MTAPRAPIQSLVDLLDASVARYPSRPLFLTKHGNEWLETTYQQFRRLVDGARSGLAQLGVGAGDRVGIIAGNRVEWAAIAYASYELAATLVPMYESQLASDWAFIVGDAGIKVLFVANRRIQERLADLLRAVPTLSHVLVLDGADSSDGVVDPMTFAGLVQRGELSFVPGCRPGPHDVAALMYTSGTTGEPKGVILSHRNVVSNLEALRDKIPVACDHRTLSFLPWAHAFGHTVELHLVISCGASIAIAESLEKIIDNLAEIRPTVLVAVPRVFIRVYAGVEKMLAAMPRFVQSLTRRGLAIARRRAAGIRLGFLEWALWRLTDRLIFAKARARVGGRLEFAISGAAALPREVAELVEGLGISVYEGYGLTETSPVVSANIPGQRKFGSVGRPLPGVRVVIDTLAAGGEAGSSHHGEIVVHGPNVTRGYYHRPSETRAVLTEDGALRTGDIGFLDEDGFLFVTGRIKEQYKLANGKYVSPAPLEERLKLSPFIADVMIYGDNREHNVALVVADLEVMRAWAAGAGAATGDGADAAALRNQEAPGLLRHPRAQQKIADEIEKLSNEFRGYERIGAFNLLPEAFTQENGMLTPSLKLKRRAIVERWRDEIERLYDGAGADSSRLPARAAASAAVPPSPGSAHRTTARAGSR